MKPKLHKYIVRLPDGKEVLVKAHEIMISPVNRNLRFAKYSDSIMEFKEWIFWKKL